MKHPARFYMRTTRPLVRVRVAVTVSGGRFFFLFRLLGYQGVGGQQEGGDASGIAERGAHDLGRVDDAHGLRGRRILRFER